MIVIKRDVEGFFLILIPLSLRLFSPLFLALECALEDTIVGGVLRCIHDHTRTHYLEPTPSQGASILGRHWNPSFLDGLGEGSLRAVQSLVGRGGVAS